MDRMEFLEPCGRIYAGRRVRSTHPVPHSRPDCEGKRCHVMSPSRTAASKSSSSLALGHCGPAFGGQSRYCPGGSIWTAFSVRNKCGAEIRPQNRDTAPESRPGLRFPCEINVAPTYVIRIEILHRGVDLDCVFRAK